MNAGTAPEDAAKATILTDGVLAPDGSIYASGRLVDRVGEYEESGQAFVTHVLVDGTLDTAFGGVGAAGIARIAGQSAAQVVLGPDGGVYALTVLDSPGTAAPRTGVTKLTAAGTRDAGYGDNGTAEVKAGEDYFTGAQMVLDPQGRMVRRPTSSSPG